jgi:penicillin amidase
MSRRRTVLRWGLRVVSALLAVLVLAASGAWALFGRSRPLLDGRAKLPGLAAEVVVLRDGQGVPTIEAQSRADAAAGLGFVHAQDRFFQMDLQRRAGAGELSALFGRRALEVDRRIRVHRFRQRAERARDLLPAEQRAVLAAYTAGVNAGLRALREKPWEYRVLRAEPAPWLEEDSLLVGYGMWLALQPWAAQGGMELTRAAVRSAFSPPAAEFLLSGHDPFDAALDGSVLPVPALPPDPGRRVEEPSAGAGASAPVVGARAIAGLPWLDGDGAPDPEFRPGSNNFAVAGHRTAAGGAAIVGNDMHLALRLPNVWYRAEMAWTDREGRAHRVTGATYPGAPPLVVGSNGALAWGFTNAGVDTSDVFFVGPDTPVVEHRETIAVKGAPPQVLVVRETPQGPIVGRDAAGREYAVRWVAHDPIATNFDLLEFETTTSAAAALQRAPQMAMIHQNLVVGDAQGHIGWTVIGRLPRRAGFDGTDPVDAADTTARWDGWLESGEVPSLFDPLGGAVWTANSRVVGGPGLVLLGDGGYESASRAAQLRDRLAMAGDTLSPPDLLALQLDLRARYLEPWAELLLDVLADGPGAAERAGRGELRALVAAWDRQASVDSAGHRLVRDFRRQVLRRVEEVLFAELRQREPAFRVHLLGRDRIALTLARERPPAWLPEDHAGWEALLLEAADAVVTGAGGAGRLERHTWGRSNTLRMRHPLADALPVLGRWLAMPAEPLPGDFQVVRMQAPAVGASQRMVVAPGAEEAGLYHQPGGVSGHPRSPYFASGHSDWVEGRPSPLRPGDPRHTLVLMPAANRGAGGATGAAP